MARPVDPERHEARRLQIVDAALTCFAERGYDGATTAAICREAGISSGTLFHYFPTKAAVLVGLLEVGTGETETWFGEQEGRDDAPAVLRDWVRHALNDFADVRVAGFVRAVGAVMTEPVVAAALGADDRAVQEGLRPWVARAQATGQVRDDLSAARLTAWVVLLLDGFLGRLAADRDFTVEQEGPLLIEAVDRLLLPGAGMPA